MTKLRISPISRSRILQLHHRLIFDSDDRNKDKFDP